LRHACSAALSFLENIMAQFSKKCNDNVENMQKRAELPASGDAVARPRLRRPTAGPAGRAQRVSGLFRPQARSSL
jgi:hypothetical protein